MKRSLPIFSIFILIFSLIIFILSFNIQKKIFVRKIIDHPSNSTNLEDLSICDGSNCSSEYFLDEQKRIEERLKNEDALNIYHDILLQYVPFSANNQHAIAHIFGEILYKSKGLNGITICDGSFAFGCFHGFLVNAIAQNGIDSIKKLDQNCYEKFGGYNLGCQHGIGHGIAEYYGSKQLAQALDACSTLLWKHQLMGCAGGVFMEHIMPTLSDKPGSVQIYPVNLLNPYLPCTQVKEKYRSECFYNLGNYFYHAMDKNPKQGIALCESIPKYYYQKTCLLGFGNALYSDNRNIFETIKACQQVTKKRSEVSCRAGAGWILYSVISTRKDAKKICEGLEKEDFINCLADSNLLQLALKT